MALDKGHIVDTALNLLDEVGLDALTTRLLAERLGVKQPALYWHFKNRQALMDAMNDRMLELAGREPPRPDAHWRDYLRANARQFRACLLRHRDGARVHAGTEVSLEELAPTEAELAFMVAAGWPVEEALDLLVAISRYIVGCVLEEQAAKTGEATERLDAAVTAYPHLGRAVAHYRRQGFGAAFEYGLELLLAGAAGRLEAIKSGAPPAGG
ncbi:TetR/AcrR family transcriptional regulator C-terminal domain-containing protein [Radicibacter daui]|uniref:TetR/AcrR family transcriptional regulator C-terminal domain-containing protein n=1 Tax=Radicibacter daui TaxID=3064829 RepID=UPI004046EDD6